MTSRAATGRSWPFTASSTGNDDPSSKCGVGAALIDFPLSSWYNERHWRMKSLDPRMSSPLKTRWSRPRTRPNSENESRLMYCPTPSRRMGGNSCRHPTSNYLHTLTSACGLIQATKQTACSQTLCRSSCSLENRQGKAYKVQWALDSGCPYSALWSGAHGWTMCLCLQEQVLVVIKQKPDALISTNTGCKPGCNRKWRKCGRQIANHRVIEKASTMFSPAIELGALACNSWKVAARPSGSLTASPEIQPRL